MKNKKMLLIIIFSSITILLTSSLFCRQNSHHRKRAYKSFAKKSVWTGQAETYGAPTINLIVDFINDCHYRMRFYYYMGVARPSVIFGQFRHNNNVITLIDGIGNRVTMFKEGRQIKGNDNGYRIYLRRVR